MGDVVEDVLSSYLQSVSTFDRSSLKRQNDVHAFVHGWQHQISPGNPPFSPVRSSPFQLGLLDQAQRISENNACFRLMFSLSRQLLKLSHFLLKYPCYAASTPVACRLSHE